MLLLFFYQFTIYHLLLPLAHIQFYFLLYLTSRLLFIPSIVLILNADYILYTTQDMFLVLVANFPHYLVVVHKHYYLS